MTDDSDDHVDGPEDDEIADRGDEDDQPVVDAGGGKEADGVRDADDEDGGDEADAELAGEDG